MKLCRALLILATLILAFAVIVLFLRLPCLMVTVTGFGLFFWAKHRQPVLTTHGTAHFATEDELQKAGLL